MADANPSGNTPVVENPAPSAGGEQTPSQPGSPAAADKGFVVTFKSKEEHDEVMRQAAQASTAQSEADRLKNKYERRGRKVEPLEPMKAQEVASITQKVSSKVLQNKDYRELLDKDPTLARVIVKNPLDLLDVDEFADEDDAINQVLDYLDDRRTALGAAPSSQPASPASAPVSPAPAAANPGDENQPTDTPSEKQRKEQDERNAKLPPIKRITNNIAGRIKITP